MANTYGHIACLHEGSCHGHKMGILKRPTENAYAQKLVLEISCDNGRSTNPEESTKPGSCKTCCCSLKGLIVEYCHGVLKSLNGRLKDLSHDSWTVIV